MGSTLKVDNIVGTSGTSAPITLSGDTATLGSAVTFPDKIRDRDVWYPIHNGNSNSGDYLTPIRVKYIPQHIFKRVEEGEERRGEAKRYHVHHV